MLVAGGLLLTSLAVPRFQYEFMTALLYIVLAVCFFWIAIASIL